MLKVATLQNLWVPDPAKVRRSIFRSAEIDVFRPYLLDRMLPIQNFTVFVTMSEKLFFFADDDDAELLLQDA